MSETATGESVARITIGSGVANFVPTAGRTKPYRIVYIIHFQGSGKEDCGDERWNRHTARPVPALKDVVFAEPAGSRSFRRGKRERLAVRWIRSSDGVYRPAPMACASPAAVVMVACRGKTFSSSTRCASSSPSEQQSPTTSSL